MRITARLDSGVLKWQQRPIRPNRRASRYPRAPARRWSSARRCWSPRSRFALRRSRSRPLARSAPRPAAIRPGWDPSPGPRVSEGRPMRRPPCRCHRQGRTSMTLRRGRVWASPPRAPITPAAIPPRRRPRSGLHTPGRRPRPPTWAGPRLTPSRPCPARLTRVSRAPRPPRPPGAARPGRSAQARAPASDRARAPDRAPAPAGSGTGSGSGTGTGGPSDSLDGGGGG